MGISSPEHRTEHRELVGREFSCKLTFRFAFGRSLAPNIGNRNRVTDAERLHDIKEKLNRWGYLSHHPEAESDMAWLLERLGEREAHIARLEHRLKENDWILLFP